MSIQTSILDKVLEIATLLQKDMAHAFADLGLSTARTHLLWTVHHGGPATQQSLATALSVTPRNITGLVDALESSGFVSRSAHPTDRRATIVTLTPRGVETMATMERDYITLANDLSSTIITDDLARFEGNLAAVIERLHVLMAEAGSDTAREGS